MGGACSAYGRIVEDYTGLWWENSRERDHLEDPVIDGSIILSYIFRKWDVGGTCECGNELSGSTKCGEFLD